MTVSSSQWTPVMLDLSLGRLVAESLLLPTPSPLETFCSVPKVALDHKLNYLEGWQAQILSLTITPLTHIFFFLSKKPKRLTIQQHKQNWPKETPPPSLTMTNKTFPKRQQQKSFQETKRPRGPHFAKIFRTDSASPPCWERSGTKKWEVFLFQVWVLRTEFSILD